MGPSESKFQQFKRWSKATYRRYKSKDSEEDDKSANNQRQPLVEKDDDDDSTEENIHETWLTRAEIEDMVREFDVEGQGRFDTGAFIKAWKDLQNEEFM